MLNGDITWPASYRYKSHSEWEPAGFFSECLCNSTTFDLMLGFFSSSAINVLSDGFATFLHNGGRMRIIINDILSADDISSITYACESGNLPFFDLNDLDSLIQTLSIRDKHFFECLSWLIRNGRIEIRIVKPQNGIGIAHNKCGIFYDGENRVGFEGSVNFSYSALVQNMESMTAFCDWNGPICIAANDDIAYSFEKAFSNEDPNLKHVSIEDVKNSIVNSVKAKELAELLGDEEKILSRDISSLSLTVKKALNKAKQRVQKAIEDQKQKDSINEVLPHFPFSEGPRSYQREAFENWKVNKQKGFFAMATGTGKTITSLNCLLEIYNRLGYYKAIIIVPTIALVDQWAKECRKFGFNNVIKVYSQSPMWKKEVADIQMMESLNLNGSSVNYVIIVTYSSMAKEQTYAKLFGFPKNKVLLIADEAHNMGSSQLCKLIPKIPYLRRIGLSATPHRQFDDVGNSKIAKFFGFEGDNYTYSYTMEEAIRNGVLCHYYYYPHLVSLTDTEFSEYLELSRKIAKFLTYNNEDFKSNPLLTALLIARKRIVHKAVNKQTVFRDILTEYYRKKKSLKYSLVYVPEGNSSDEEDIVEESSPTDDIETLHLIDKYTSIVRDIDPTITVAQYTSDSKNREELLSAFVTGHLDVLTSMKCLDEGVDVPRSELAIFCASTGNPRQFIQRRGRILRTHKNKQFAIIHDLVVAPMVNCNSEEFNVERNLLRSELRRVKDFAMLSENPTDTLMELTPILNYYNLNIYDD